MKKMIPLITEQKIEKAGLIAVIIIEDVKKAIPLAKTLLNSGITAMELTLRTRCGERALSSIVSQVPEITAGAGTVLTKGQLLRVKEIGAAFAVAPGLNRKIMKAAIKNNIFYAPGVCIPSEIEYSADRGCNILKFFHAEGMGGIKYLKGINAPYKYLGLRYIPLGGLNIKNMKCYLEAPEVLAIGGSWIAPPNLINAGDWDAIARNADEAVKIVREVRG